MLQKRSTLPLEITWNNLRLNYFPLRPDLDNYKLKWNARYCKRTLATCNPQKKVINVSTYLNTDETLWVLEPLLYHEMCHAALGRIPIINGKRVMHGYGFKALEKRHPLIKKMNEWIKGGGWRNVSKK